MKETTVTGKKERLHMRPTRKISLSFIAVIIVGSILLSLPCSNQGEATSYLNHLLIATSATCVTGLVSVVPAEQYTIFGQVVIISLIQIGGLGFLTFLYLLLSKMQKKLSLAQKMVFQEALNQTTLKQLPQIAKRIITYVFIVEGIGALLLMLVFVPEYGAKGIYYGIYHAISAFCNAGFDVLGSTSLINYQTNPIITLVIPGLIILGGLGFTVWFDILDTAKALRQGPSKFNLKLLFSKLHVHSKIVLVATALLLATGTILFYICEFNNMGTLGEHHFIDQLQISYFQSATIRTAGFASVDMVALNDATKLMMCIFMFIGGSPLGTAGGIKTITFAIIVLMIYNTYKGNSEVNVFKRRIKKRTIVRSFAILSIALSISLIALFTLSITEQASFIDLMFEVFSAIATVGLTSGITPNLTDVGKIVVILLMYIGRIGVVTLVVSFARKSYSRKQRGNITYTDGDIMLG